MSVRPEPHIQQFADKLIDDALDQLNWLTGELQPPFRIGTVVNAVQQGKFLSNRLRIDVSDAVSYSRTSNVLDDLKRLVLNREKSVFQTVRLLVPYFLKFRYYDLSRFECDTINNTINPDWTLPPEHELLHQIVQSADNQFADPARSLRDEVDVINSIYKVVKATPWLGSLSEENIVRAVSWLIDIGFIKFQYDRSLAHDADVESIPVLSINEDYSLAKDDEQAEFLDQLQISRRAETRRRNLVSDLGVGLTAIGSAKTYEIVEETVSGDILKIGTYHFRTAWGERDISDLLLSKENLKVKILCIGPTTKDALNEGADTTSLMNSLSDGILGYRKLWRQLPTEYRKNIEVRVYGDELRDSFFRGTISCAANGRDVKAVLLSSWPHGVTRANYGELLYLEASSNAALLVNDYFDRAWDNSVPMPVPNWLTPIKWIFKDLSFEFFVAAIVLLITLGVFIWVKHWQGDAFFASVGFIAVLIIAIHKSLQRVVRVVKLAGNTGTNQTK